MGKSGEIHFFSFFQGQELSRLFANYQVNLELLAKFSVRALSVNSENTD